jgi:23S rRNA pseudouridine1911/1915/1917 synthase
VKKYGNPCRYFLHATHLRFAHPRTGEVLEFHSVLPRDLQILLDRMRS